MVNIDWDNVFSETPVVWIWIGGGIVVVSAIYIARFEAKGTY